MFKCNWELTQTLIQKAKYLKGIEMFSLFKKDKKKELQGKYEKLMEKAVEAQRKGDIATYSELSAKADELAKEIDSLKH